MPVPWESSGESSGFHQAATPKSLPKPKAEEPPKVTDVFGTGFGGVYGSTLVGLYIGDEHLPNCIIYIYKPTGFLVGSI